MVRIMRWRFFLLLISPFLCLAQTASWSGEQSDEEALFLRRIADFWQEKEVQLAKSQMEEFIVQFPESGHFDLICLALGDLNLREKNYESAMGYYLRITAPEFSNRAFLSRMQCLYQMEWYATLADECEEFLSKNQLDDQQKLHTTYFLAIALYQQCLNAAKDPDTLNKLASRAQPYFEILFQSELSTDVAQAFAHLCCILKDHQKASSIYCNIAEKDPSLKEEMLFQAALIQSEYDKREAVETFNQIVQMGEKRSKEASYNKMVLIHELGLHEELALDKEQILQDIPSDRQPMAHLFLGRSFLALKKFKEAAEELTTYIEQTPPSESTRAALINLLDASFQSNNLATLDLGIVKLREQNSNDPELPKALLSRAQILKKEQQIDEARLTLNNLLKEFPDFPQKAQAAFELAHLEFQTASWDSCRRNSLSFLQEFPDHDLSLFAWRHLVSASSEIAAQKPEQRELKEQLIVDLEALLAQSHRFSSSEQADFQFLLATTLFELGDLDRASQRLQDLLTQGTSFSQQPNALLLLSLCYRDKDPVKFCQIAETALNKGANLLDVAHIHTSLFNVYIDLSEAQPDLLEKAIEHLYAAFEAKAEIQPKNLLWLADVYYSPLKEELENDLCPSLPLATRTAAILERAIQSQTWDLNEENLYFESAIYKLAKLYSVLSKNEEEIALLEKLMAHYQALPQFKWIHEKEARLLLAEAYLRIGREEKASPLFDFIVSTSSNMRSKVYATASLQSARLKFAQSIKKQLGPTHPELMKVLSQLKDIVLQRSLQNEPIHLEAALDYIDFHNKLDNSSEKKLKLLIKTKSDFEQTSDLLSRDYQESRTQLPRKNLIYEGYIHLMEAEILYLQARMTKETELQKELQAKAKDILLQIIEEQAHPALLGRARQQLSKAVHETKT